MRARALAAPGFHDSLFFKPSRDPRPPPPCPFHPLRRHTLGFALTLISTRRCAHTRNQISMLKSGKTMKRISITCVGRGGRGAVGDEGGAARSRGAGGATPAGATKEGVAISTAASTEMTQQPAKSSVAI